MPFPYIAHSMRSNTLWQSSHQKEYKGSSMEKTEKAKEKKSALKEQWTKSTETERTAIVYGNCIVFVKWLEASADFSFCFSSRSYFANSVQIFFSHCFVYFYFGRSNGMVHLAWQHFQWLRRTSFALVVHSNTCTHVTTIVLSSQYAVVNIKFILNTLAHLFAR